MKCFQHSIACWRGGVKHTCFLKVAISRQLHCCGNNHCYYKQFCGKQVTNEKSGPGLNLNKIQPVPFSRFVGTKYTTMIDIKFKVHVFLYHSPVTTKQYNNIGLIYIYINFVQYTIFILQTGFSFLENKMKRATRQTWTMPKKGVCRKKSFKSLYHNHTPE